MCQLIRLWKHRSPAAVLDVAITCDAAVLALGSAGVEVVQQGASRLIPWEAEHLVTREDGNGVLLVSPVLNSPVGYPLRQIIPGPVERWKRRVATLEPPWKLCKELGEVEVQDWCPTYDGRRWGVFEGDDVRVLLRVGDRLEEEWAHRSFWPTSISHCSRGLWLETSSLGASHYEILGLPDLTVLESGDLESPPIRFPPELIRNCLRNPRLRQPLFLIDSSGLPTTLEGDRTLHHPILDKSRLITLNGFRIVEFAERPVASGLAAEQDFALIWVGQSSGLELYIVDLATAQLLQTFQWRGGQRACAHWRGRNLLVGDDTGRVSLFSL